MSAMRLAFGFGAGLIAAALVAWAVGLCHRVVVLFVCLLAYGATVEASERLRDEMRYLEWQSKRR